MTRLELLSLLIGGGVAAFGCSRDRADDFERRERELALRESQLREREHEPATVAMPVAKADDQTSCPDCMHGRTICVDGTCRLKQGPRWRVAPWSVTHVPGQVLVGSRGLRPALCIRPAGERDWTCSEEAIKPSPLPNGHERYYFSRSSASITLTTEQLSQGVDLEVRGPGDVTSLGARHPSIVAGSALFQRGLSFALPSPVYPSAIVAIESAD